MRSATSLIAIAILVACPSHTGSVQASTQTASELLDKYKSSMKILQQIQFSWTRHGYKQGGAFPVETWTNTTQGTICFIDGHWRIRCRVKGVSYYAGITKNYEREFERLFDGDHVMLLAKYARPASADPSAQFSSDPPTGYSVAATFADSSVTSRHNSIPAISTMYGYAPRDGSHSLSEVVESGSVESLRQDVIGAHTVYVITCRSKYGLHELWLDPDAGFLPRKVRVHKTHDDLFGDKAIRVQKAHGDPREEEPNSPIREHTYEVLSRRFNNIEGDYIPRDFVRTTTARYLNGARFVRRDHFSIFDVQLNPSTANLDPTMDVPDGSNVHVTNVPEIDFVWRNGDIHKVFDGSLVRSLADLSFAPEQRRWGGWVLGANIVIVAVIAAMWIYRRTRGAA